MTLFVGEDSDYVTRMDNLSITQAKHISRIRITKEVMLEWLWEERRYLRWLLVKWNWR